MSEHHATIRWSRNGESFDYKTYPRKHEVQVSGQTIRASSAPDFAGDPDCVDPEEALVAALSSCHMLTFLALCSKKRITIDRYEDQAVGYLEKNDEGHLAVTRVVLKPSITFAETAPTPEELESLHHRAHKACFIANSVKTKVKIEG